MKDLWNKLVSGSLLPTIWGFMWMVIITALSIAGVIWSIRLLLIVVGVI